MSDRIESPGTASATAEAANVLRRSVSDDDLVSRLADRIVQELQTQQYHRGMRVLVKTWQSKVERSYQLEAVASDVPIKGLTWFAAHDAMTAAAHVLWEAEDNR